MTDETPARPDLETTRATISALRRAPPSMSLTDPSKLADELARLCDWIAHLERRSPKPTAEDILRWATYGVEAGYAQWSEGQPGRTTANKEAYFTLLDILRCEYKHHASVCSPEPTEDDRSEGLLRRWMKANRSGREHLDLVRDTRDALAEQVPEPTEDDREAAKAIVLATRKDEMGGRFCSDEVWLRARASAVGLVAQALANQEAEGETTDGS